MKKETYSIPRVDILRMDCDIITFSETEEWTGPVVGQGLFGQPDAP